jgi:hypothetical protein
MAQSVRKVGEPTFVNVWRAGVTRIVAKVTFWVQKVSREVVNVGGYEGFCLLDCDAV